MKPITRARDIDGAFLVVGCWAEVVQVSGRDGQDGVVVGLSRGGPKVLVELDHGGEHVTYASRAVRVLATSICDRCSAEFPARYAESCVCGGTFDADCLHEHGCADPLGMDDG